MPFSRSRGAGTHRGLRCALNPAPKVTFPAPNCSGVGNERSGAGLGAGKTAQSTDNQYRVQEMQDFFASIVSNGKQCLYENGVLTSWKRRLHNVKVPLSCGKHAVYKV